MSSKYEMSSMYKAASIKRGKNIIIAGVASLAFLNTSYLILNTATRGRL